LEDAQAHSSVGTYLLPLFATQTLQLPFSSHQLAFPLLSGRYRVDLCSNLLRDFPGLSRPQLAMTAMRSFEAGPLQAISFDTFEA